MKHTILAKMEDLVSCFLYYDRKADEDLPLGVIDSAVKENEIVEHFRSCLETGLND